MDLDHVAIAVERWADAWPRYAHDLGGRWRSGGQGPGFAPAQISYANGMKIEVIAPHDVRHNDFLRRFLDRSGPGPHHFTFKVDDLQAALDAVEAAGYRPVNVDLRDPTWKEAFLHPKDAALGVVIQLAQSTGPGWVTPPPVDFPSEVGPQASLSWVGHAVASLSAGLAVFAGLLGGEETASGEDEAGRWVDLAWPGPGRIRLLSPTSATSPLAAWLADRPGRLHHIAFACDDPAAIRDATPLASGAYEVAPERACGTRLLLS